MTAERTITSPAADGGLGRQVDALLAGLVAEPWGQVTASVYETARLAALAPWLPGHAERLRWLRAGQRADGGWGPPGGYAVVPTLSATDALLAAGGGGAAQRGLAFLGRLMHGARPIPDTPAADLIVPALVERIAERTGTRLPLPAGVDGARLAALRRRFGTGATVPPKLLHALEVLGDAARGAPGVRPAGPGTIGASPAATAAWLGERPAAPDPYLAAAARTHGGPVPCATPITVFERAWVLGGLARAGVGFAAPPGLVASLTADWGPDGTAAGPGLPADADTTAVVLFALAELGHDADPGVLQRYDVGEFFCTWPGEDGFSVTTNAHVLDAFGIFDRRDIAERISQWLCLRQEPDGSWRDRWHASPYYATACCVLALSRFGRGPAVSAAVARAARWAAATQRPDGSWGRWQGTPEETAYAVHVLLAAGAGTDLDRAGRYLAGEHPPDLPMWHDKDLYAPHAIVRGAVLAARHLLNHRRN
ncbi:prenyltransferase/squalene oxidase repeat-containing protein [Dactylosporangium sp. NPDC000244]|uniref:prenyltransferase/squalene oxidase repeat-containing protein n=1 Tax=Dactylosporangium sp. NPDC000244 TaxID=3154365 RepID=UPI0033237B02